MPECHTCPKNRNRDVACLACTGPADSPHNDGRTFVSVEEVEEFVAAPEPDTGPSPYDHAVAFVRSLCRLRTVEREIVFARLNGETFAEITARLNLLLVKPVSLQAVHARAKKALESDPAFRVLFAEMAVKQERRKVAANG